MFESFPSAPPPTVLTAECNTMFVAKENLPNSFFPCGYVSVVFRIYLHTLQPIPTLFPVSLFLLFASAAAAPPCVWGWERLHITSWQSFQFRFRSERVLRKKVFFWFKVIESETSERRQVGKRRSRAKSSIILRAHNIISFSTLNSLSYSSLSLHH